MKHAWLYSGVAVVVGIIGVGLWSVAHIRVFAVPAAASYRSDWNPAVAASYLDSREAWWQAWPSAQLQQRTFCVSCHTALPYALARPLLRNQLGQTNLTPGERDLLSDIETRVNNWPDLTPYYTDSAHAAPSHATEAVLNAFILANYSASQPALTPITQRAFDEAWGLQLSSGKDAGGWQWQDFHEAPWEAPESAYQGAAMMALAAGLRSDLVASDPAGQEHVEQLRQYLVRQYPNQPPINQLFVLWASSRMPALLDDKQRSDLIARIAGLQHSDGGWSLASLDKQRALKRALFGLFKQASDADVSDGCATGLSVLALEASGTDANDPVLQRGLAWLKAHQRQEGSWWAASLNGFRNQSSGTGHFMSDAATGYAVLALEQARMKQAEGLAPKNSNNGATQQSRVSWQSDRAALPASKHAM